MVSISPVPAADFVRVSGIEPGSTFSVSGIDGIMRLSVLATTSTLELNTSSLAEGVYFATITTNGNNETILFVVKR
jgi:hypothetical protein